jgi:hypothetical protein
MNSWIPWENATLLECTSGSYWKYESVTNSHLLKVLKLVEVIESSNAYYPFTSTSIGAT